MEPEQKKLWKKMMDEWDNNNVSCHLHFAKLYTAQYPSDMFGWIALADALFNMARYNEARNALEKSKLLCPKENLHIVFHQIGHLYKEKGNYPKAKKWYRKSIENNATTRNFIFLGSCLAKQGKFKEAKECHRKAIEISSDPPDEAYFNLGLILRAEKKFEKALESFEKALEFDPEYKIVEEAKIDIIKLLNFRKCGSL
jgi:tetratricopeptide (TPR) repeat protein